MDDANTLYPEWLEAHKEELVLPPRILALRSVFGHGPDGITCKNCAHLLRYHQGARWMKCNLSKMTQSVASDWRAGWPACGKYEETK